MESFGDGVIAIIITIMVFQFQLPRGGNFTAFRPLIPILLTHILNFIYIGGAVTIQ
jgi:uncharacterized membrane protein